MPDDVDQVVPDDSDDRSRAWMLPWLRVNLLLLDMTKAFRVREARPVLQVEIVKGPRHAGKLKRGAWWN